MLRAVAPVAFVALTAVTGAIAQSTGVEVCDDFISKFQACISTTIPAAQRSAFQDQLDKLRTRLATLDELPSVPELAAKVQEMRKMSLETRCEITAHDVMDKLRTNGLDCALGIATEITDGRAAPTGVAVCDNFISTFQTCINTKIPSTERGAFQKELGELLTHLSRRVERHRRTFELGGGPPRELRPHADTILQLNLQGTCELHAGRLRIRLERKGRHCAL